MPVTSKRTFEPTRLAIDVNALVWSTCGGVDGEDPSKLISAIIFGETMFHVEAFEVRDLCSVQVVRDPYCEESYAELCNAFGGDGPFGTVEIEGRDYVLFISPYCD